MVVAPLFGVVPNFAAVHVTVDPISAKVWSIVLLSLKIDRAPFHGRRFLFALPKLKHGNRPESDEEGENRQKGSRRVGSGPDGDLNRNAHEGRNGQGDHKVLHETEIHPDLLAKVFFDVVQRQATPGKGVPFHAQSLGLGAIVQRKTANQFAVFDAPSDVEMRTTLGVTRDQQECTEFQAHDLAKRVVGAGFAPVKTFRNAPRIFSIDVFVRCVRRDVRSMRNEHRLNATLYTATLEHLFCCGFV
mmetsp:Transcript_28122/g.48142  ORF Transcript_28122/g.48142 Transcript_28122/m.48142 type:complete len:245 (-) Transcript_28122:109-843(-)